MSDIDLPVTVVTVAWGEQPELVDSVRAVLASRGVDVRVVIVDNGATDDSVERAGELDSVEIVDAAGNTGFAGGCNRGAAGVRDGIVALVNPDAIVDPDCLAELARALASPSVGAATALITFTDRPGLINSAGNEVHPTGMSWCGRFEHPVGEIREPVPVLAASGACMAVRAAVWHELGGFCEPYFAYYEDADLSLRLWQRGYSIELVPSARASHTYEFSRNRVKFYLAERNRLMMVVLLWPSRLVLGTLPLLFGLELGMLAIATSEGWLPAKLRGYRWLVGHRRWLRAQRRENRSAAGVRESEMLALMTPDLYPTNVTLPSIMAIVRRPIEAYCRLILRWSGRPSRTTCDGRSLRQGPGPRSDRELQPAEDHDHTADREHEGCRARRRRDPGLALRHPDRAFPDPVATASRCDECLVGVAEIVVREVLGEFGEERLRDDTEARRRIGDRALGGPAGRERQDSHGKAAARGDPLVVAAVGEAAANRQIQSVLPSMADQVVDGRRMVLTVGVHLDDRVIAADVGRREAGLECSTDTAVGAQAKDGAAPGERLVSGRVGGPVVDDQGGVAGGADLFDDGSDGCRFVPGGNHDQHRVPVDIVGRRRIGRLLLGELDSQVGQYPLECLALGQDRQSTLNPGNADRELQRDRQEHERGGGEKDAGRRHAEAIGQGGDQRCGEAADDAEHCDRQPTEHVAKREEAATGEQQDHPTPAEAAGCDQQRLAQACSHDRVP